MKNKNNEFSKYLLRELGADQPDLTKITQLIADGADVNYRSVANGYTPLMIAAEKKQLEIVKILLDSGADITLKNNDGRDVFRINRDDEVYFAIRNKYPLEVVPPKVLPKIAKKPFTFDQLNFRPVSLCGFEPAATDDQISELERYCGHALPERYKEILKKYNHGSPGAGEFLSKDAESGMFVELQLSHFYVLDNDKGKPSNLWWHIQQYEKEMGRESLPFATDGCGQIYYMKWVDDVPQVWYLVLEDNDESDYREEYVSHLVMNSFDELLEALYVTQE